MRGLLVRSHRCADLAGGEVVIARRHKVQLNPDVDGMSLAAILLIIAASKLNSRRSSPHVAAGFWRGPLA